MCVMWSSSSFLHHDFVEEEREHGLLHLGTYTSEKLVVAGAGGGGNHGAF